MGRAPGGHPAVVAACSRRGRRRARRGFPGSLSPFRPRPAYATRSRTRCTCSTTTRVAVIGRTVLEELLRLAELHGFHSVIARIAGSNDASIRLHAACGFELVGTEREVGRKFGRWLDVGRCKDFCNPVSQKGSLLRRCRWRAAQPTGSDALSNSHPGVPFVVDRTDLRAQGREAVAPHRSSGAGLKPHRCYTVLARGEVEAVSRRDRLRARERRRDTSRARPGTPVSGTRVRRSWGPGVLR